MISDIGVIKAFPIDGHPYETFPKLQSKKYEMSTSLLFYNGGLNLDYLGVYYKNIMYYISTDTNAKVVKHFLDQGNKNRIIENSQIPNQHLLVSKTKTLQGTFELMNFCLPFKNCLFFKNIPWKSDSYR